MSETRRIAGNRVYCYECQNEWDRSQGGLQCPNPNCGSEFVEILEPSTHSPSHSPTVTTAPPPPIPPHPIHGHLSSPTRSLPFHDHNPWAPDPDEDDITTFEFNSGRGRGTFSITSRSYTIGGPGRHYDPAAEEAGRDLESMVARLLNGHNTARTPTMMGGGLFQFSGPNFSGRRGVGPPGFNNQPPDFFSMLFPHVNDPRQQRQPNPFDLLGLLLNPGNAQHGDMVFTQEAFDRVMTQLMEQNHGSGAPPASEAAINSLQKRPVNKEMMGSDGKAECSICMDNVEVGDEVTFLPCNHWFHEDCVVSWLKEHDTCPHCRQPISNQDASNQNGTNPSRRRGSRRTSSTPSPAVSPSEREPARYGPQVTESPSGRYDSRQRYYGGSRGSESERPNHDRRSTSRSERSSDQNSNGGVGGWIRNHMPF